MFDSLYLEVFVCWKEKKAVKMQKAKEYDWKDSNMALFGSDTEKKVN